MTLERVYSEEERAWESVIFMFKEKKKDYAQAMFKSIIANTFLSFKQPAEFIFEADFRMSSEDMIYKIKRLDIDLKRSLREKRIDYTSKILLDYIESISKDSNIDYKETTAKILKNLYLQQRNCICSATENDYETLTTSEAAEIIGVSNQTVRRWLDQGKFSEAYQTDGGHWRIPKKYFILSLEESRKADQIIKEIDIKHSTGDIDEFDLI